MSNTFHETFFIVKDGQLLFENKGRKAMYDQFQKALPEGAKFRVFIEEINDNHTVGQINKLHKCIRMIAEDTGNDFQTIKDTIKERMGYKGESFGDASYEELDFAIKETIRLGEEVGLNLY